MKEFFQIHGNTHLDIEQLKRIDKGYDNWRTEFFKIVDGIQLSSRLDINFLMLSILILKFISVKYVKDFKWSKFWAISSDISQVEESQFKVSQLKVSQFEVSQLKALWKKLENSCVITRRSWLKMSFNLRTDR